MDILDLNGISRKVNLPGVIYGIEEQQIIKNIQNKEDKK